MEDKIDKTSTVNYLSQKTEPTTSAKKSAPKRLYIFQRAPATCPTSHYHCPALWHGQEMTYTYLSDMAGDSHAAALLTEMTVSEPS